MTDSETDTFPNNMYSFQHQNTTVSAKGPNVNNTNISSMSFRNNNMLTSTMNGPWNRERPRYAESAYDQRSMSSMYYRREHSPSSYHSASGFRGRNLHNSYYPGGMSSNRSMYNGRAGSPCGSVRTVDSNTTVSAMDIASAFKTMQFSKFDLRIIKDAYHKYFKQKVRKRIEKRRNLKLYMKASRRKSGYDSGELGSNSSISSDDCRSTQSRRTMYRDNVSSSCRSTKTNISDLRRNMKESSLYLDCTDNFKMNTFLNKLSVPQTSMKHRPQFQQPMAPMMQKDRFQNGYSLPSQRFNHSIASQQIPVYMQQDTDLERFKERDRQIHQQHYNHLQRKENSLEMDSEQDEIFTEVTVMDKGANNAKRGLDEIESMPKNKRSKTSSPQKKTVKSKTLKQSAKENLNSDFVFAKPQFPVKKTVGAVQKKIVVQSSQPLGVMNKSLLLQQAPQQEKLISRSKSIEEVMKSPPIVNGNLVAKCTTPKSKQAKTHQTEILISKSKQPEEVISNYPMEELISKCTQPLEELDRLQNMPKISVQENHHSETLQNTTDVSMRPSFIKRKLYTQKLEERNASSDSLEQNSPQGNIYSAIQKEKNKTRKLITQSCLSRDVLGDESNLLDLIHKIVPPDRMNATNANKTDTNKSKPDNDAKWDVSHVIDKCKDDDVSDTFTDEDIFTDTNNKTVTKPVETIPKSKKTVKQTNETETKIKEAIAKPKQSVTKPRKTVTNSKELATDKTVEIHKPKAKAVDEKNMVKESEVKSQTKDKEAKTLTKDKEIKALSKEKDVKSQTIVQGKAVEKQCKVLISKMPMENSSKSIVTPVKNGAIKSVYNCVKSFWDTDAESDLDTTPLRISILQESRREDTRRCGKENSNKLYKEAEVVTPAPITPPKNNTVQKLNNKSTNAKNNKTKKTNKEIKKLDIETEIEKTKTYNEKSNKETKVSPIPQDTLTANTKEKPKIIKQKQKSSNKITLNNNSSMENNITIKTRSCRTPKIKICCEDRPKHGNLNSSGDTSIRSLRSREVDLSSSLQSAVPQIKKPVTKKAVATNNVAKGGNNSSTSDLSFTLAMDTTILTRRQHAKLQKLIGTRTSDVSFSITTEPTAKRSVRLNNTKMNDSVKTDITLGKHKLSPRNKSMIANSKAKNNSRFSKRTGI